MCQDLCPSVAIFFVFHTDRLLAESCSCLCIVARSKRIPGESFDKHTAPGAKFSPSKAFVFTCVMAARPFYISLVAELLAG